MADQDGVRIDGFQAVVEMMVHLDEPSRAKLLKNLREQDPALVERILQHLFQFEDIATLSDADIQTLYAAVQPSRWALALRMVSESFLETLFRNLSRRAREALQEEMESLPPQRQSLVEEAQQEILTKGRELEADGKLLLQKKGTSDELV